MTNDQFRDAASKGLVVRESLGSQISFSGRAVYFLKSGKYRGKDNAGEPMFDSDKITAYIIFQDGQLQLVSPAHCKVVGLNNPEPFTNYPYSTG